jgi:type IV fimbrial biogenesis protein FimT
MLNNHHYVRGFTLIELMITVSVLAIMLALGVPAFTTFIGNSSIRTNAEAIANGIQLARTEAVRRNANVRFVLSGATWTVNLVSDGSLIQERTGEGRSDTVTVTAAPGGTSTLTFTGTGTVTSNADASAAITEIKVNANTPNAAQLRKMCIMISTGGVARMCDPLRTLATDPQSCQPAVPAGCV